MKRASECGRSRAGARQENTKLKRKKQRGRRALYKTQPVNDSPFLTTSIFALVIIFLCQHYETPSARRRIIYSTDRKTAMASLYVCMNDGAKRGDGRSGR